MRSLNYHFQFSELLKRFSETLILTNEQVETSYEFLFEDRKFLPFQGQTELTSILNYLKDNMAINNLATLDDLLRHYRASDQEFSEFLDDLTEPSPSTLWVSNNQSCCSKTEFQDSNSGEVYWPLPGTQGVIKALVSQFVMVPVNIPPAFRETNLDLDDESRFEVGRQGAEENCLCES